MRDLSEVIDAMLKEIPASEVDLVARLTSIKNSAFYTAPEGMVVKWRAVQKILVHDVGEPKDPWQRKVADIFVGKEVSTK